MTRLGLFHEQMGEKLRSIRRDRGITQAELGAKINKTQDIISKIENGERALPIEDVPVIAEALDIMPGELFIPIFSRKKEDALMWELELWIEKNRPELKRNLGIYHFGFGPKKTRFQLHSLPHLCDIIEAGLEKFDIET